MAVTNAEFDDILSKSTNIKYEPDAVDIMFKNGDIEKITPSFVTQIVIEKDYDTSYFPVTSISLNIRPELYTRVVKEKETVKVILELDELEPLFNLLELLLDELLLACAFCQLNCSLCSAKLELYCLICSAKLFSVLICDNTC